MGLEDITQSSTFSVQGKKKAHDFSWAGKNESYNSLTKTYTLKKIAMIVPKTLQLILICNFLCFFFLKCKILAMRIVF